ncbi:LysE family translocator [Streptomyces sp. DSM 42041]|uniref:LysE family translocator n=1 Tax=Streptomyces hazeniae TaxID=3075538 RepID=A0ABU2NZK5_9ACTN|nr:LysE family translocator [Streptomyces sp. DSM 42041]MDT0381967.1 LysE family translocator [Streptomyces sp. DSM 42041]
MTWQTYGSFVVFALALIVIPGPDFAVVTKNTLSAGRVRGAWASAGVASSNAVQGMAAAVGLGALIVASQPVFTAVKWAGVAYLAYLGVQALRSAWRGDSAPVPADGGDGEGGALRGWRQGFLSNITNPKVLVFYLAVLPQFLPGNAPLWQSSGLALTHAALSLGYLLLLVTGLHRARRVLSRRTVRRALDAVTGTVLLAFSARLARDHA